MSFRVLNFLDVCLISSHPQTILSPAVSQVCYPLAVRLNMFVLLVSIQLRQAFGKWALRSQEARQEMESRPDGTLN